MSTKNMAKRTAAGTLALAVCLGGGALALAGAAQADSNFKFGERIAGDTRFDTAVAASKKAYSTSDKAIIVNGYATVDGLTASYLAGVMNAPILYTDTNGAPQVTRDELKRLGVKSITVIGGTTVIPEAQVSAMKSDGYTVTRISGSDRYETAANIAEAGSAIAGKPSKVFVASGDSFADALAVSPVAFAKKYPVILTGKNDAPDFSTNELGKLSPSSVVVVGGESVISAGAYTEVRGSERVAGADRAVTANLVADWSVKNEGFKKDSTILVGGTNSTGADSLVAAPFAGAQMINLHFAGWDATQVFLKDHAADLTGKGYVFGGTSAVVSGDVSKAESAAQSVAAATSYVVTDVAGVSTGSFKYADPTAKSATKVVLASTDKYTVGGVAATQGAFAAALSVGDVVAVSGTSGSMTYSLTNKTSADYTKGMVGAVDTASGTGHHKLSIGEPVTNTILNADVDYTGAYTLFTVDGATVSQTIFESSIQLGDMVAISGTGADASHIRTIALTNSSVSGMITGATGSAGSMAVTVKTDAGASFTFTQASGDTYKLDGAASTQTLVEGAMSAGDTITVSRSGGVSTYAVVNSAPSSVSGVITGATSGTVLSYLSAAGTVKTVTYSSDMASGTYIVDGKVASPAEFLAAVTPGDQVTFQAADSATSTAASLSLVSKPLSGKITASSSTTVTVSTPDGDVLKSGLAYTSATSLYSAGTSLVYSVDGVTKTQAQFVASIGSITSGALQGTVTVSIANGVVTYALATTAYTAAPVAVSASEATASGTTTVTVVFNKPISGTLASGDFTAKVGSGSVTNVTGTVSGSSVTFTLSGATSSGTTVVVALTTAGAAKITDVYGTATSASSLSYTM